MRFLKHLLLALSLLYCAACGGGGGGSASPAADTTAPTVAITSPAAGTVEGSVSVTATAADNTGVSRVEFLLDGAVVESDSTAPYTFDWNTRTLGRGNYTLAARAYDAAGNAQQSAGVTVTIPISAAMTTVVSGSTATGTVSVYGLPALDVYGLDFQLTLPAGATIASVQNSGTYAASGLSFISGAATVTHANTNLGNGEVMVINFSGLPVGATGANFGIAISAVFDGAGLQIQ